MTWTPVLRIGLWNGWLIMSVFLLQMLVMALAGKRVMKRSHVAADFRRERGKGYVSLLANLLWLMALILSVFLPLQAATLWFYAGLVLAGLGALILSASTVAFIRTPPDRAIKNGVYRFSRHPMYLSTFLVCLGCGLATGSPILVLICMPMAWSFREEAIVEEQFCLSRYGRDYQDYLTRAGRWWGIRRNHSRIV